MHKLLHKIDLTRWYEKYSPLVTAEGKKQFTRTVYTLSLCAMVIIFVWYCGIMNLNSQNQNELTLILHTQSKVLPASAHIISAEDTTAVEDIKIAEDTKVAEDTKAAENIKYEDDIKNNDKSALKNETSEKASDDQSVKDIEGEIAEVAKASAAVTPKKEAKVKEDKKNYDLVKKTIYMGANTTQVSLTFDDGYNKKTVEKVLDVLKANNIKSTFFIIGKVLDDYPEVWKRAVDEGHQICNHTNYHELLTNMSDGLVEAEILGWETSAKKVFGEDYIKRMKKEFPYLRLPGGGGGKSNRILSIAQKNGYKVIGWNLETNSSIINPLRKTHSVQEISKKIEQHVVNNCSNGAIILLHFNQYDIGNIEGIVKGIKNRGYDMQPISQILK